MGKDLDESGQNRFKYTFENIFRMGLEQVITNPHKNHPPSHKNPQKPNETIHFSKPKGLFSHREKSKTMIRLEGKTARFTTYASRYFSYLRAILGLEDQRFLAAICGEPLLSMSGESGKSGASFYTTKTKEYVIKTITLKEKDFLISIVQKYVDYLDANRHSLLSQFLGLYKVTFTGKNATEGSWAPLKERKIVVIMNNVLADTLDDNLMDIYDLKGTNEDRYVEEIEDSLEKKAKKVIKKKSALINVTEQERIEAEIAQEKEEAMEQQKAEKKKSVKKDINFIKEGRELYLNAVGRVLVTEQLRRDVEFLLKHDIMDYSFLVGIKEVDQDYANTYRQIMKRENLQFDVLSGPRIAGKSVFRLCEGGIISADRSAAYPAPELRKSKNKDRNTSGPGVSENDGNEKEKEEKDSGTKAKDFLYFIGVIDILQPYNFFKKAAHLYKKKYLYAKVDNIELDTVKSDKYAARFLGFMNKIIKSEDFTTLTRKERATFTANKKDLKDDIEDSPKKN